MPRREMIMLTVEKIYEARVRGDKQALSLFWAPNATFRIVASSGLGEVMAAGPSHPVEAVSELVDQFRFHAARIVDAVIDGNKAAVHMEIEVSAGDGPPETTELLDLWEFDEEDRVQSLQQFIDTALATRLAAGYSPA